MMTRIIAKQWNAAHAMTLFALLYSLAWPVPVVVADVLGPTIDVWYGHEQSFGQIGTPQTWINIVGNVSDPDGVASLAYSLNGAADSTLSVGPDLRRLADPGDFNIDIAIADLLSGSNEVVISATDALGHQSSTTVNVGYTPGNVWPLPHAVAWDTVTSIEHVAQVIDGQWDVTAAGARTAQVDYDRLLAIGDIIWQDYEVLVPITIHALEPPGILSSGQIIGMIPRWTGHTDFPAYVAGRQPKTGWLPSGAQAFYRFDTDALHLDDLSDPSVIMGPGQTWWWRVRVTSTAGQGGLYQMKVWQDGDPEPQQWNLTLQRTFSADPPPFWGDPSRGSLLLVAHHVDLTIGDLIIQPTSSTGLATLASDDFNACALDPGLWQIADPLGDATVLPTGIEAMLAVPAGTAHTISGTGPGDFSNDTPRIMQATSDGDFELQVRFESGPGEDGQSQGILIEQDADDLLQLEFRHEGSTQIRAVRAADGAVVAIGSPLALGSVGSQPLSMRVRRAGEQWTISYSVDDGLTWPVFQTFSEALAVSAAGVFVGNDGAPAVAHTVLVDYFFDTTMPIDPEDADPCLKPDPIIDLAATTSLSGDVGIGSKQIQLSWTAVACEDSVVIYRKGFGFYPEYDSAGGSEPSLPAWPGADGWEHVATVAASQATFEDEPLDRDFWYYMAYTRSSCGILSDASNRTPGCLNYLLGDVSDAVTIGQGNGMVATEDLSLLGAHYGGTLALDDAVNFLDVGPTTTNDAGGRPLPDDQIDFEDVMIFSLNFSFQAGPGGLAKTPGLTGDGHSSLSLITPQLPGLGQAFDVIIQMHGAGEVQGLSIALDYDETAARWTGVQAGELLEAQDQDYLLLSPDPGVADLVLLGVDEQGIVGEGTLLRMSFELLAVRPLNVGFAAVSARGLDNQPVAIDFEVMIDVPEQGVLAQATELHGNVPNPFNPRTEIAFSMGQAGRARVRIYGIDGRLVRTLVDESLAPGRYARIWDGTDQSGRRVASGAYLVHLEASGVVQSRRIMMLK